MQLGMIGLGRMGANMARRLMHAGHQCIVYDLNPDTVEHLAGEGALGTSSLEEFVDRLGKPRAAWLMVPAGNPTEQTVQALATLFEAGDLIIDGGNSYFKDDVRRAKALKSRGIHYVDVGTSGGVWGVERGYCLMIGGRRKSSGDSNPSSKRWRRDGGICPGPRPGRTWEARQRRAICIAARPGLDISSRWSITA